MPLVAILIGVVLIGAVIWLLPKLRPVSYSPEKMQALAEALYQIGYDDAKADRPERSWDDEDGRKSSQSQRDILNAAKSTYLQGRQDALDGKPSIAEEIKKNRKQQLLILGDMIALLRKIEMGVTPRTT